VVVAVIAAAFVSFFSLDLGRVEFRGQSLEALAETYGSRYLERPLHIGGIEARMSPGVFVLTDVVIEGRTPADRPFFRANRIRVHVPWWTMFRYRVEVELEITGWAMVVEKWGDGRHNIPKLTPKPRDDPRGPTPWTTTVRFAHANGGTFTYEDHGAPWSVVAPNLDFSLGRSGTYETYLGRAHFDEGAVQIRDFLPMRTEMTTRFRLEGSKVELRHIDLLTDGAVSHVTGSLDFRNWPVQTYQVNSTVDFPRMREIFFAHEDWRLGGTGRFRGVFQIFNDGRDLSGDFASDLASVNDFEFPNLRGSLVWRPELFRVTQADADLYGGRASFTYGIEPLGTPGRPTASFAADYADVDLQAFLQAAGLEALDPAGRAAGSLSLAWPNGQFSSGKRGEGRTIVSAPVAVATAAIPAGYAGVPRRQRAEDEAFDPVVPLGALPLGADLRYRIEPERLAFDESWAATPSTYVAFDGQTAYGDDSEIPFHVTSLDWQQSDRLLAAIMTAFGAPTGAVEVGGYGRFDGTMTKAFRAPRVAGRFDSDAMRAWDVTWGRASGDIVIENAYLDITGGLIGGADGPNIRADGRFALGFPRRDGGEELNARVVVTNWNLADIRHAFHQDDWPIDGTVALADLQLHGPYSGPFGSGTLRLTDGSAWGERFPVASTALEFEGRGVRMRGMRMAKGAGSPSCDPRSATSCAVSGDGFIDWDGSYVFTGVEGQMPVESLDNFTIGPDAPLTGILRFRASGAGTFESPRYEVQATIADLFIGDEGIGQVTGQLYVTGDELRIAALNVTEPRVQFSGGGSIALNEFYDSKLSFRFLNTSIDPYLKFIGPEVSPFTGMIASGTVDVTGALADLPHLLVDVTVDDALITPLDYELTNDGPLRLTLEENRVRLERVRLRGENTQLVLTGGVDLGTRAVDISASGDANLAILQVFFRPIQAAGAATLTARISGPIGELSISGEATIADGNIRHFDLPHSLTAINGPIRVSGSRIDVSGLRARMGDGDVAFGGEIILRSYVPEEFNVSAHGRSMRLRYPEGFTSRVDADLELTGPVESPLLSGTVDVLSLDVHLASDATAGVFGLAGGGAGSDAVAPPVEETGFPLRFDIDIQVPPMQLIKSQAAAIDGSANMRFTGTIDRPSLNGRVAIDGGTTTFAGNRYTVRQGSIDFGDFPRQGMAFDVEAVTRPRAVGQTFDVTVRLTGTLEELTPTITSDPWLPTSDVISLLLGGRPDVRGAEQRGLESAAESQARMMQTAGAVLLASPVSDRISSAFQEVLPIDTVQVTPVLGNEASLQQLDPGARIILGQRISSRVFLTYSRVLNSTQDEIILLEYDQSDRVSWVLSRNENRTFALDFRIRYVF
jgi:hypothetical protein